MRRKTELPEVDPVVLKNLGNIRPGAYILIGGIILIILILFIALILPGLTSKKAYARFNINAKGIAIYENGEYIGSSEGSIYTLQNGKHTFTFKYNDIELGTAEVDLKKNIFASLFRRKINEIDFEVNYSLELEEAMKDDFAKDVAKWSAVIDYDKSYNFPPLYSEFAYNAKTLGFKDIDDIWLYGAMHVTSDTLYEDYKVGREILQLDNSEIANADKVIDEIFSGSNKSIKMDDLSSESKPVFVDGFYYYPEGTITMGRDINLGYPETNLYPTTVTVEAFSIAATPISEYEYALFVEANPYWAKSNIDNLISDGMVDKNYLAGITLNSKLYTNKPIRNISWNAANAYTEWLSNESGKNVYLPSEAEWTRAALSAEGKPYTKSIISTDRDISSPSDMLGQLWEFTSSSYIPLARAIDYDKSEELAAEYPYDDIIIKGGSYINTASDIDREIIGVLGRNTCSEYAGFRIAVK